MNTSGLFPVIKVSLNFWLIFVSGYLAKYLVLPVIKVSLNFWLISGKTSCFTFDKGFFELLVDFCFRLPGKTSCFTCDKGQYQDEEGQTECKNCQPGLYSISISMLTLFSIIMPFEAFEIKCM